MYVYMYERWVDIHIIYHTIYYTNCDLLQIGSTSCTISNIMLGHMCKYTYTYIYVYIYIYTRLYVYIYTQIYILMHISHTKSNKILGSMVANMLGYTQSCIVHHIISCTISYVHRIDYYLLYISGYTSHTKS